MIRKESFLEIPENNIQVSLIQYEKEDMLLFQKFVVYHLLFLNMLSQMVLHYLQIHLIVYIHIF